ncbi:hypothetical protein LX32DRAFT_441958 [Colletotrichum zoysiae]|uniref:DUF1772 domain-containing protein n=1 Tax=Colletotrichum zoysiae TaxID=1216348 RepID=A0AAD9HTB1_9PEZI|nr:hypothetical protein LX32DRAFT_441958 [Colletotrichum zoysiae]
MASQSNPLRGSIQASTTVFVNTTLAGLNLGLSVFALPRLLESPTPLMLRQWSAMFARASRLFPMPTFACALSYWSLAYRLHRAGGDRTTSRLLAAAGALCFAIMPWTRFLMEDINRELNRRASEAGGMGVMAVGLTQEEQEGSKSLVDRWGLYNLGRIVAVGLGGVIGLYTIASS